MDLHVFNEVMKRIAMFSFRIVVTSTGTCKYCYVWYLRFMSAKYKFMKNY